MKGSYGPGVSVGRTWEEKQKNIWDNIFEVIKNTQRAPKLNDWRTTEERRRSSVAEPPSKHTGEDECSPQRACSKIDGLEDEGDGSDRDASS
jgi:hypothetical protein